MTEVSFSTYEGAEVLQTKVYLQDSGVPGVRAAEYVDFTDRLGQWPGKNLLLNLSGISKIAEGRQGVSFQSSISSISWFNGSDRFWSKPFPLGTGTVYGRTRPTTFNTIEGNTAYFTVSKGGTRTILTGHKLKIAARVRLRTGNEIETDLAVFLIDSMTQATGDHTVSMKVTSIAQPLLDNSAEIIKDGNGWYQNRNIAFLIKKILEDQYKVPDYDISDPTAGTLPSGFIIPDRILVPTDDWLVERQWMEEHPGGYFTGPDPRVLSNYGRPPEWDGTRFREDGLIPRAIALWQTTAGTCSVSAGTLDTLTFSGADDMLPTGKMGPRIGDFIVLRDTTGWINDGSYEILTIPASDQFTVKPELKQADSGMQFTITVILTGCDDQLWEYIPENERYNRLTSDGVTPIALGTVVNGDGDTHSLDFRMLELNGNQVFVWAAWNLPRYKEAADPVNWDFDLTSKLRCGMFWRNETEGDTFYQSALHVNVMTGELIFRALQYQWWPNYWPFNPLPHYNRQAGSQLDLSDPAYVVLDGSFFKYNDSNRSAEGLSPPAWCANRGYGVILPFAQKLWVATRSRWGETFDPNILNHYGYIFANKTPRSTAYPGWYEEDPLNYSETFNPDADNAADGKFTREDFVYPRPGKTDSSVANLTVSAKEVLRHTNSPTTFLDDPGETFRKSVQVWSMPENSSYGALTPWAAVSSQELVIAQREEFGQEEMVKPLSLIPDAVWHYENNVVASFGVWTIQTPVVARDRNRYPVVQWDTGDGGSLVIPHSWGTKGCVVFAPSSAYVNGIVAFPVKLTEGTGIHWKFFGLNVASVATVTSITTTFSAASPVTNIATPPTEQGSGTTSKEVPYNSRTNSFDNDLDRTFPISAVGGSDGCIYFVSLRYGLDTAVDYRKATHIIDRPQCDIVKLDTSSNPSVATVTRLYNGSDSTNIVNADDYYIPVDIYHNSEGGNLRELLVVLMAANLLGKPNCYRLALLSGTDANFNNRGMASHVLGSGFQNKPTALTYDTSADMWYAILGGTGNLVNWPVIGENAYKAARLDYGFPTVRDESWAGVKKLAIDSHTRRDPQILAANQEIEAFQIAEGIASNWLAWTSELASEFDAQDGSAGDFVSYLSLYGSLAAQAMNFQGLSSLKYVGTGLSSTAYEVLFEFGVGGALTPNLPYSTNFEFDTTALFDEHHWDSVLSDRENWIVQDIGGLQNGVLKGTSYDGEYYTLALQPVMNPGCVVNSIGTGSVFAKPYSISELLVDWVYFSSIVPDSAPQVSFRIDLDKYEMNYVGFTLTRATPSSNWTVRRISRIAAGAPTDQLVYTFTGGPTEFFATDFSARIVRSGNQYTFYINLTQVDQFTEASAPIGGMPAFSVKNCIVLFDDLEIQGTTVAPRGGLVISDAGEDLIHVAVMAHPDENKLKLWGGAGFNVLMDEFDFSGIVPLQPGNFDLPDLRVGSRLKLRVRKDMHGDGRVKIFLENFSTTTPVFDIEESNTGSISFGPIIEEGFMLFDILRVNEPSASSTYDPSSRSIIWGVSAPTFSYEFANGDEPPSGKYFLWKYDIYYASRIELADFSGMSQWKALQEFARYSDHVMGFELDNFFFLSRLTSPTTEEVIFKTEIEGSAPNLIELEENDGMDEVYNRVVITPGNVILKQPEYKVSYIDRTDTDLEKQQYEFSVEARGTRQQSLRLKCVKPGKLATHLIQTPVFVFLVTGKEIETYLVERKETNGAPHQLKIAESVVGISAGDNIEISVTSEELEEPSILRGVIESAIDQEDGGVLTLTGLMTEDDDFPATGLPIGTTVLIQTDSIWSDQTDTIGIAKYWPVNPTDVSVAAALESGKYYEIGTTNVFLRITDPFFESNLRSYDDTIRWGSSGEDVDEKELYLLGLKQMGEFRPGDIIEIEIPGLTIESGELFTSSRVNMSSVNDYGKRQYPVTSLKFLSPRQAKDLARRVIRDSAFPQSRYTATIPFNPSVTFLDQFNRLRRYTIQDQDLFSFSPGFKRTGIPRSITHDPVKHTTTIILKDEEVS